MASLSGWTFVIIGSVVAIWSYFQESLLFFSIVGGVMALYGVGKIIFARALRKSETPAQKPHASGQSREAAHAQMQAYRVAQAQRLLQQPPQQHHAVTAHTQHHAQPSAHAHPAQHVHAQRPMPSTHINQPQTAYKICPNCKKHMHVTYRFCPHCGWGV